MLLGELWLLGLDIQFVEGSLRQFKVQDKKGNYLTIKRICTNWVHYSPIATLCVRWALSYTSSDWQSTSKLGTTSLRCLVSCTTWRVAWSLSTPKWLMSRSTWSEQTVAEQATLLGRDWPNSSLTTAQCRPTKEITLWWLSNLSATLKKSSEKLAKACRPRAFFVTWMRSINCFC